MGQLHQILAVEDSKVVTFKKIVDEAIDTFSKKDNLFKGAYIKQESTVDQADIKYKEFPNSTVTVPVAETIPSKLRYVFDTAGEYFDLVAQKDATNCTAKADLIIDGKIIKTEVPAVTLLFIENKFKVIRAVVEAVKTLDPAKNWTPTQDNSDVYSTDPITNIVKEAIEEYKIIVQATDKHPAQTQKVITHEIRATKSNTELSGLISSRAKSKMLQKIDKLINACKQARQTANNQETVNVSIAQSLFDYIIN